VAVGSGVIVGSVDVAVAVSTGGLVGATPGAVVCLGNGTGVSHEARVGVQVGCTATFTATRVGVGWARQATSSRQTSSGKVSFLTGMSSLVSKNCVSVIVMPAVQKV